MRLSFDCVFYYATDMDRAVEFYNKILGLKLTGRDSIARFDIDGVLFELVPAPAGSTLSGTGNARLCLEVGDIDRAVLELRERGVAAGEIEDVETGKLAFFEDPEGNEICLWQYHGQPARSAR